MTRGLLLAATLFFATNALAADRCQEFSQEFHAAGRRYVDFGNPVDHNRAMDMLHNMMRFCGLTENDVRNLIGELAGLRYREEHKYDVENTPSGSGPGPVVCIPGSWGIVICN